MREYVNQAYAQRAGGPLPAEVAESAALIVHVVRLEGSAGITLQHLEEVFARVGRARYLAALAEARSSRELTEQRETRPNRAGNPQRQVVLYDARFEPTLPLFA